MPFMPGSTVQCVNPVCDSRGSWKRADLVGAEKCPACGEPLRQVPPPLMPHMRMRPRHASRPALRPR